MKDSILYSKYDKTPKEGRSALVLEYGEYRDILSIDRLIISVDWDYSNEINVVQFLQVVFKLKADNGGDDITTAFCSTGIPVYEMSDMINRVEKMKDHIKGGGSCTLGWLNEYVFEES